MNKKSNRRRRRHNKNLSKTKNFDKSFRKTTDAKEERKFHWNFTRADSSGRWSVNELSFTEFFSTIWHRMKDFEGMDWNQIMGRRAFHFTPVRKIHSEAQKRFHELYNGEYEDSLFSLNVNQVKRVWAVQVGHEGYLIWYDPKHEIYEVPLKNT